MLKILSILLLSVSNSTSWILPRSTSTTSSLFGSIAPKDFKTGLTIQIDGVPTKIVDFSHVKQARGAASTKTKFKNMVTGATLQRTVQASESFDPAIIERTKAQFTYSEGGLWFFMDSATYEEKAADKGAIGDNDPWLFEGMECGLVSYEDKVIDVDLPSTCIYTVTQTDPNVKGNTAQGVTKPATVGNGASLMVPGFIEENEKILVDLGNKAYMSRAKKE